MRLIADLHIHSRFSRATSRDLDFVTLYRAALEKGIGLVGTGDFTHPGWFGEISEQLEPAEDGLFRLRPELVRTAEQGLPGACSGEVRFMLQVEISNIYKKDGRVRKNHNLVFLPSLDAARRFNERLAAVGNLASDGRPILGLDAHDLLEITLECDPAAFLVPAHIWTPWFSLLGSKSGFDSLEECFGDLTPHIFAVETGLSSDPPMNWRLSALDRLSLVSNSDAHSAAKLGREACLFDIEPSYPAVLQALRSRAGYLGTLEFFPEEGKYHLDGHRKCGLRLEPEQTRDAEGRCPTCGGVLTVGVMSRVLDLADRPPGERPAAAPGFTRLVPLDETVSEVLGVGAQSKRVRAQVQRLLHQLGPELAVLTEVPLEEVGRMGGAAVAEAVRRVRSEELQIEPGYDGEFGTVRIFAADEREHLFGQLHFFGEPGRPAPRQRQQREPSPSPRQPRAAPAVEEAAPQDPLDGLDQDQLAAATAECGPLLVVAGPGTGKTRTLVARVVWQLRRGLVQPQRVLAITFTNQAAEELQQRIGLALGDQVAAAPTVTTFHGLGRRLLAELSGREPRLLEEEEREQVLQRLAGGDARQARDLGRRLSLAKQGPEPRERLGGDPEAVAFFDRYQAELETLGKVDLDDLVLRPLELLRADPVQAERLGQRFELVAVDEYQDVNDVQAALVQLLAPDGSALCAIGDPNQAIYGFRGARPGHFARFADTFPGTRTIALSTSYRLTRQVLAAAVAVVAPQHALAARRDGPRVELVAVPTPESEAEQIVVRLERLVGGTSYFAVDSGRGGDAEAGNVGFGDVAVLCRTKAQRPQVLEALGRSGIPARVVGEDEAHDPRAQKVAVMTMHAAKGREFEVVFVTGVEQGLLPLEIDGWASDPEEERRLLYVALTRGKRLVVISHAARRTLWGRRLPGAPSPFLAALPAAAVSRVSPELPGTHEASRQLRLF